MRAIGIGLLFFILTGGGIMGDVATADDKKADEKKDRDSKDSYTERVTFREWGGSKFANPADDTPALFEEIKGKPVCCLILKAGKAAPKSEIIDKDGAVWVVTDSKKATGKSFTFWLCYVAKKEPEKKP